MGLTIFNGFLGVDRDWDFLRGFESADRVLLGYSMGGRLALQVLLEDNKYDRAVIVSLLQGDPGQPDRTAG